MFDIHFNGDLTPDSDGNLRGEITLGESIESFDASTSVLSGLGYMTHWASALDHFLTNRTRAALFSDLDSGLDGVGLLRLFCLTPSEHAGENESVRSLLSDFPDNPASGVYLTEHFRPVTTDPDAFRKDATYEDNELADSIGLYFLDLNHSHRFFSYLNHNLIGISHWFYANECIADCKMRIEGRCRSVAQA